MIDKTGASDPKKRENYWIRTLRTLAPDEAAYECSGLTIMAFHALSCYTGLDFIRTTVFCNTIFDTYLTVDCCGKELCLGF